jgi:hypothetical protein
VDDILQFSWADLWRFDGEESGIFDWAFAIAAWQRGLFWRFFSDRDVLKHLY